MQETRILDPDACKVHWLALAGNGRYEPTQSSRLTRSDKRSCRQRSSGPPARGTDAPPHACTRAIPNAEDDGCMASQQIAKLSMQAALRTLDIQERAVEQLRLRSGVLLAACSLIASIFGGAAIRANHGLGASGVVALAALAISTSLCVYLLLTKRGLTFTLDAEDVYEFLRETDNDDRALKELIGWLVAFGRENSRQLWSLDRVFVYAAFCLMVQMVSWSVMLLGTLH